MSTRSVSPQKRTRFDADASTITTTASTKTNANDKSNSPSAKAESRLKSLLELRPAELQPLLLHHGLKIISLNKKVYHKKQIITKMEDANAGHIPKSVKLNVTLTVMQATKDRNQQAVTALEEELRTAREQFEQAAKATLLKAAKADFETLKSERLKETTIFIQKLAEVHLLSAGITNVSVHEQVQAILTYVDKKYFSHKGTIATQAIRQYYTQEIAREELPQAMPIPELLPQAQYNSQEEYADAVRAYEVQANLPQHKGLPTLKRYLEDVLIAPWNAYLAQEEANTRARAVLKATTEHLEGTATDAAAMEVEAEVPADQQQLQEIIKNNIAEANKPLLKLIDQQQKKLEELMSNSNLGRRGQTQPGASRKKKSGPGPKNSNQQTSQQNRGRTQTRKNSSNKSRSKSANPNRNKQKGTSQGKKGNASGRSNSKPPQRRSRSAKRASRKSSRSRSRGPK